MASGKDNDDLLKRLLAIFQVEAAEHLKAMSSLLQALAQATEVERAGLVETLFREAHSLKGAARSVNLYAVEGLCKALESVLAELKGRPVQQIGALPADWFATMYRATDALEGLLAGNGGEGPARDAIDVDGIVRQLERLEIPVSTEPISGERDALAESGPADATSIPLERSERAERTLALPAGDSVRVSTARLAALQVQTEELLALKFSAGHLSSELRALGADVALWKKAWSRTVRDGRMLRRMQEKHTGAQVARGRPAFDRGFERVFERVCDAIERDELAVKSFAERLRMLERGAEQERRSLTGLVDALQDGVRQALMRPFASLLELFPKLVRDLARDSGKEVELRIEGAAIEVDRGVLEQMKDPLIHLVRNAIDHGIETPDVRRRARKPVPARISVGVTPKEGNRVELVIADDGAGVSLERLKGAAEKLGLVAAKEATEFAKDELLALMFESGLSTSPMLTDLSGHGLGLAIVREKVERLGGSVGVELPATGGTLFRIVLPTTLATFRGLLVALGEGGGEGGDQQFVLPSRNVERVLRMPVSSVKTVENREVVEIAGQAVAMAYLADVLGLARVAASGTYLQLVVLEGLGKRIAFAVDAILGDQEVLVKSLGPQLRRVPNVAGATVLGPGRVVPILNVADLLKSAQESARRRPPLVPAAAAGQPPAPVRSLLVAEDSVTTRILMKSILESVGYRVTTAVDGIDALTALRSGQFDLVVSDVEMPRMDGFELTAHIRADKKLADLPVVLVTALESREHKELGIEAGANAYIVKSSFDQSNLFEVIRRLV
jgi:two-component system chemotaxis sensor kinase CheA